MERKEIKKIENLFLLLLTFTLKKMPPVGSICH